MSLRLYNTLTRRIEPFKPLDPATPTMYVCGPTVYNYVHIGNARGPVLFGVLADLLRRRFGGLRYARNITDVDDKINAAAKELGAPISTITDRFAAAYREDMAALGIAPPDLEPEATAHIPQIIAMIERLIANGNAYAAEGHVLFAVNTFSGYGKLSRRDQEDMLAGARVEVAPYKRDPGDFVLWKPSTGDLPGWRSPWGRGRPGWHIECSAMAAAHLGETIDIHAGGIDLQFPHHENEIAQSECAHGGKLFARWWLHNGMLNFGGAKMSKSVGNIERVHNLVRTHKPEALRYALLSAHYRQPLDWSDELISRSRKTLDGLYDTLLRLQHVPVGKSRTTKRVETALDDDLNTPKALSILADFSNKASRSIDRIRQSVTCVAKLADSRSVFTAIDEIAWLSEKDFELRRAVYLVLLENNLASVSLGNETKKLKPLSERTIVSVKSAKAVAARCSRAVQRTLAPIDKYFPDLAPLAASARNMVELRAKSNHWRNFASEDVATWQLLSALSKQLSSHVREVKLAKASLLEGGKFLGLLQQDPEVWFKEPMSASLNVTLGALSPLSDTQIQSLTDEREEARRLKDFARADAIREQLAAEGVLLEDTAQGVRWKRA